MLASLELPITRKWVYDDEPAGVVADVEFRLIYDGRLPSQARGKARVDVKHEIRQRIHIQLANLWREHPSLQRFAGFGGRDEIASHFTNFGFTWVPLINQKVGGSFAALDILFLRRNHPGGAIQQGDIDNRLKVLFDALRVPRYSSDLEKDVVPQDGETPFYCLLEDDSLITSFNLTTDRLLTPFTGEHEHPLSDTVTIITVKTGVFQWRNHAETFA